ncbi:MAG: ATP-grasp domain-containing protein, partial [Oligoflexia bacterium]|nr:ATP-grasp domain-containing protein [Oligoflexia bacterium]
MTGTNFRNLGIIGAGQLARMICLAAHTMGIRTTVFAGHATDCAVEVANDVVLDQKNSESLKLFLDRCDLVTFENEFFDLRRILELGGNYAFAPDLHSMGALQSKLGQKLLLQKLKIPTSRFVAFDEHQLIEMERVIKEDFRRGCVIKRAFGGYDGRGNISISSKFKGFTKEQSLALEKWGSYYIEEFIGFKNEVSIVGARNK